MKKLLIILSLFVFQNGYSQLNLDSLFSVWNNEQESDSTRLYAMWTIAYDGYLYNNPDSTVMLAKQMYDFAESGGEIKFQGHALGTQGSAYYHLGKSNLAIECHEKALKIYKKIKADVPIVSCYNNIANVYRDQGRQSEALNYFFKALKVYEKIDHKEGISTVLGNIGSVYGDLEEHEKCSEYYRRALVVKKQTNDKVGISLLLAGIGERFHNIGIYDSAMYYQTESLKIRLEIDNKYGIASSLKHIGEVYDATNQFDSAIFYYNKSLVYFERLNLESGEADVCFDIALAYRKHGDYKKAMNYAKRTLKISTENGFVVSKRDAYFLLFQLYKKQGNHTSALKMHEEFIIMKDSVEKEVNRKAIIKQEFQYDYDKKVIADSIQHAEEKKLEGLKHEKETENQQIIIGAVAGGLALVIVFLIFVFNRLQVTRKQKTIIEEQKEVVEEKNQEITDSITYAKRIQSAILPPTKMVKEHLKDSFVLYKPKDIVAGDFYWLEQVDGKILFAAADCTGHGVPGAMVSVVCNNALNRSVREHGLTEPGKILNKTRELIVEEFEKSDEDVKDGMDIALCSLEDSQLKYAGAHNPLWIIRNGEIMETKADKQPIGKFDNPLPYTTHVFEVQKGDAIYIFSDGYVDQFGGEKGKKFKAKAFRELLLSIQDKLMEEQKNIIDDSFEAWRGSLEQIDDVCVIGVRIE